MGQQKLNYSQPNDGEGETRRSAFVKIDQNFDELYGGAEKLASNTIDFEHPKGALVGDVAAVRTGDLVLQNPVNGITAIIFHSGPATPNYTGGTIVGEMGAYVANKVNCIALLVLDASTNKYLVNYGGEVKVNSNTNPIGTPPSAPTLTQTEEQFTTGSAPSAPSIVQTEENY